MMIEYNSRTGKYETEGRQAFASGKYKTVYDNIQSSNHVSFPDSVKQSTLNKNGTFTNQALCHHISINELENTIIDYLNNDMNILEFWTKLACVINPGWIEMFNHPISYITDTWQNVILRLDLIYRSKFSDMTPTEIANAANDFANFLNNVTANLRPGNTSTNSSIGSSLDIRIDHSAFWKMVSEVIGRDVLSQESSAALVYSQNYPSRGQIIKASESNKELYKTKTGGSVMGYENPIDLSVGQVLPNWIRRQCPIFANSALGIFLAVMVAYQLYALCAPENHNNQTFAPPHL